MSINVNTEDYQIAQELLDNSKSLFTATSDEISSVMNTLDGQVLNYVRADLALARSTMDTMQEDEKVISQDISTEVVEIQNIEARAAQEAQAIASTAAPAAAATGATPAEPATGNKNTWAQGKEALSALGELAESAGKGILEVGASLVTGTFSLLTGNLGGLFDSCKSIFKAAADIGKKAFSFVKESLEFIGHAFLSTAASLANLVMSLVEGILSFVEAIVDAAAMIVGVAASLFTGLYDGINWIGSKIFGYEFKSATKAMWANGIMKFVGFNAVGTAFDKLYEWGPVKAIEDKAFGWFKREDGIVYEIGKGVGYTVGIVLATVATCGIAGGGAAAASAAGGAAGAAGAAGGLSATTVSTAFAGLGAMGKNTQKGYNSLSEEEKQDGWSLFKVGAYGVGSGVIEAGAWYLTFGGGKNVLANSKMGGTLTKTADGLNKVLGLPSTAAQKAAKEAGQKVFGFAAGNMGKVVIQVGKTYANATNKYAFLSDDPSVGGYFQDVILNTENAQDALIAGGISLLYDGTAGRYFSDKINPKVTNWFKTAEKGASPAGTTGTDFITGGTASDTVKQQLAGSGWHPDFKGAAYNALKDGAGGKIFGGFAKKFYDYRNILELLSPPGSSN